MDVNSLPVSIPAAVAVIATVGLFLRHIADQRDKDRTMWTNHLSTVVKTLDDLRLGLVAHDQWSRGVGDRIESEQERVRQELERSI